MRSKEWSQYKATSMSEQQSHYCRKSVKHKVTAAYRQIQVSICNMLVTAVRYGVSTPRTWARLPISAYTLRLSTSIHQSHAMQRHNSSISCSASLDMQHVSYCCPIWGVNTTNMSKTTYISIHSSSIDLSSSITCYATPQQLCHMLFDVTRPLLYR